MERKRPPVLKPRLKRGHKWAHHRGTGGGAVVAVPSGFPAGGPRASSLIFQSLDFLNSKMGINGILFIKIAVTR